MAKTCSNCRFGDEFIPNDIACDDCINMSMWQESETSKLKARLAEAERLLEMANKEMRIGREVRQTGISPEEVEPYNIPLNNKIDAFLKVKPEPEKPAEDCPENWDEEGEHDD